jgi:hypothetical protein
MMAGVIALGCVGIAQPAAAQHGGFSSGHGGFSGGHFHHGGFGGNRFFFSFGFPGFGFGGYPYYPYYPAYYYPPYYPYYPYYPPYAAYPAAGPGGGYAAGPGGGYPATASPSATVSPVDPATVREVQDGLAQRGYDVGPVDGRLGPRTKAAIREYEQQNGLPVDGLASRSLRDHLQSHPAG